MKAQEHMDLSFLPTNLPTSNILTQKRPYTWLFTGPMTEVHSNDIVN